MIKLLTCSELGENAVFCSDPRETPLADFEDARLEGDIWAVLGIVDVVQEDCGGCVATSGETTWSGLKPWAPEVSTLYGGHTRVSSSFSVPLSDTEFGLVFEVAVAQTKNDNEGVGVDFEIGKKMEGGKEVRR